MTQTAPKLKYFAGGWKESKTAKYMDCFDPSTGEVIAQAPQCTASEVEEAIAAVAPYHATVPSFGMWGYCLARPITEIVPQALLSGRGTEFGDSHLPSHVPEALLPKLRFLNDRTLQGLFDFPEDAGPVSVEINRLDNQMLVRYYEAEWSRWN